jgi:hypothetical protein
MVEVNYFAVLSAGLAGFALGAVWYGPLFGKKWQALMGFTEESMKSMAMTPARAMALGAFSSVVMAYVLFHVIVYASAYSQAAGLSAGLTSAFWMWVGFVGPVSLGLVLWEGKPWSLWLLNTGYNLGSLLIMGAVLGAWM